MKYVEAPAVWDGVGRSLFLAGGITGCPDWQADVVTQLADSPLVLLNPRRADFPIDDPTAAEAQIAWEFSHIGRAWAILFWFPAESICPIALYELGAWTMQLDGPTYTPIFVGTDPDYPRRQDIVIQTRLAAPSVPVVHSLDELVEQVRGWLEQEPS